MYTLCVLKTWNVWKHGDQDVMLCLEKHLKHGHTGMNRWSLLGIGMVGVLAVKSGFLTWLLGSRLKCQGLFLYCTRTDWRVWSQLHFKMKLRWYIRIHWRSWSKLPGVSCSIATCQHHNDIQTTPNLVIPGHPCDDLLPVIVYKHI